MSESSALPASAAGTLTTEPIPPYFGLTRRDRDDDAAVPTDPVVDPAPAPEATPGVASDEPAPSGGEAAPAGAEAAETADAERSDVPMSDAPSAGTTASGATASDATVSGATASGATAGGEASGPAEEPAGTEGAPRGPVAAWALTGASRAAAPAGQTFPTLPVTSRPGIRARRVDPMTRMGPWAPAAGAVFGLVCGLVVAAVIGGRADSFAEHLSVVLVVIALTMLGAAAALLGDEVRLVRRGAREAGVRPEWVATTAQLIRGVTPARLLLGTSAFVLFLAAYTAH